MQLEDYLKGALLADYCGSLYKGDSTAMRYRNSPAIKSWDEAVVIVKDDDCLKYFPELPPTPSGNVWDKKTQQDIKKDVKRGIFKVVGYTETDGQHKQLSEVPPHFITHAKLLWEDSQVVVHNETCYYDVRLVKTQVMPAVPATAVEAVPVKAKPTISWEQFSDSDYVDTKVAAELLGVSPRTLQGWRLKKSDAPAFTSLSPQLVKYKISVLREWAETRIKRNTSE